MSGRNPNKNSVLQALLDCADSGYENMTVAQLITKISSDAKCRNALQEKWNGHSYPEKSLTWMQYTIDQHAFMLSDTAFKVVTLLAMYCHQSGLIQIKKRDVMTTLNISESSVKRAFAELAACGVLRIESPAVRHSAPVYRVSPALFNKGVRRQTDVAEFTAKLDVSPSKYLFNKELSLQAHVETIYATDSPTFNRYSLIKEKSLVAETPETETTKKGPAAATTDPRSDKSVSPTVTIHHRTRKRKPSSPDDGQMSIYDWLGEADD